jgi:acetoin utilization deacetylase AcuC-like enzyme
MTIITSARCTEYRAREHPERPERISRTVDHLKSLGGFEWVEARPAMGPEIERVHPPSHYDTIASGDFFDADSPAYPRILEYALLSAGAAIQAAELALEGKRAFSLMRPPGHHCTRDRLMGFCYFNNIAIAIESARSKHKISKAAVFDFDCHHGNGTEEIFSGDANTLFASLHQDPCYPHTGLESRGNILNYPLPPRTPPGDFLKACAAALEKIQKFKPQLLGISAGFDAYKDDPITEMSLEVETFFEIGKAVGAIDVPQFAVLEGGYADELPLCIAAFLEGWNR